VRIPLRRAGIAVLLAASAIAAIDATLLHTTSSPQSVNSSPVGRNAATGRAGVSGRPAGPTGAVGSPRASDRRPGDAQAPGAGGRVNVPPAVTLDGAAALPSADVHPGYATPADVVEAFYQALLGGTPTRACAYATNPCPSSVSGTITGSVSIVYVASDGNEALVEVTGTVCRAASCLPLLGHVVMPTGSVSSFSASWAALTSGAYGWASSPLPCVRDAATGQWLVKLS
jgi:hypothetical protein